MRFKLYIHYLCVEFAICLALYVQVTKKIKITLSFMVQVKQLGAASQG